MRIFVGLVLVVACGLAQAAAQEFTGLAGPQHDLSQSQPATYQWRLDYQQGLGNTWYFEVGWVNDGHFRGHLRDGIALQIGARTKWLTPRLSLGLAAGVDRYYDTIRDSTNPGDFADKQGFLFLGTGQISYYAGRWIIRGQVNVEQAPPSSYNAWSALIGLGYQLQANGEAGPRDKPERQKSWTTGNEISWMGGQSVLNGGSAAPKGLAAMVEYRHGIARYFDLTFSYVYQGDSSVIVRNGLAVQVWPTRSFGPVAFALGVGAFFAIDQKYTPPPGQKGADAVAGIVSPTISFTFSRHWVARFIWNRTVTTYNYNTDFFGLGVGYKFGEPRE